MTPKVKSIYHRMLTGYGFLIKEEVVILPPGMGEFAAAEIIQRCWLDAQIQGKDAPHWHGQNPWADRLTYVPIEELAECYIAIGKPFAWVDGTPILYDVAHCLDQWGKYGDKLDAYILTGPLTTAGIRFGPEGPDYLSPGFSLPKLRALMLKYGSQKRKSA